MGRKGEYRKELQEARNMGFIRARIDGKIEDITKEIKLNKHKRHDIDIVIDRLLIKQGIEKHIFKAISQAMTIKEVVIINIIEENRDMFFSMKLACPECGTNFPDISPRFFSFNSPYGACPGCKGLGQKGSKNDEEYTGSLRICPKCHGSRLRKESLGVKINGINIAELTAKSVHETIIFFESIKLNEKEMLIASRILKEIRERLSFLERVGLGYLTLSRPAMTLSGGEAQRTRLATQIGSSLTGVLYIFDEPSIGLHPRDCSKLLDSLISLREQGNTVIVVEHDEDTIRRSDHIIDMGPGAGLNGGYIVAEGSLRDIINSKDSLTGSYLSGARSIPVPGKRRRSREHLTIIGAKEYNLKNIDIDIPLGVFTCITGVSGSGKSTLTIDILYKALMEKLYSSSDAPGIHDRISGIERINKVIDIDQSPLGRTPRSNPATYTGVFTYIRDLLSKTTDSRIRGYKPRRFSFNVPGGRCEVCKGAGLIKVSMHFLPDVYVPCEACKGARYNTETLEIKYKGKNISDILNMTVSQALDIFSTIPSLSNILKTLDSVGLGYIQLGQSATTLSGGEAQRVKLSRELSKKATGKTLYILDEPTTGLHFFDIQKLLEVLNRLVEGGNSVIVIEHNLDVIKCADHIIDLGPGGGEEGGRVIASGTPEEVILNRKSHTGRFLKRKLLLKETVS
jgi:excinuclease ABC subunit A